MPNQHLEILPIIDLSIVTFNSSKWIIQFFDSLRNQVYPLNRINILIRDNGSTDDTVVQCREMIEKFSGELFGIQFSEGDNYGFGYGHNRNLKLGTAPYFLVTNVDLEFEVDSIRQAVVAAENDDAKVASWEFRQKPYEHPKYYNPISLETRWSSSACILFRRSALEAVKGYEERIFMYGEDVELSYRLRDNGYKLKYCPKAVCWHYCYEKQNQLKPVQFFGSTLANFYIRLRYGSVLDIFCGVIMYCGLWVYSPNVPSKWKGLWKNFIQILRNAYYFLATRKQSKESFPIRAWDYELSREGAFYTHLRKRENKFPLVSVVMRTYRGRLPWLREATASVVNQTYPQIELIIIEDGSEEARDFARELANGGHLTSVVYQSIPKLGRCQAGNAGLKIAQGAFIAFLDDDDLYFADHLEVLIDKLQANKNYAGAYGLAFYVPTSVKSSSPLIYEEKKYTVVHRQRFSRPILWHHNYIPIQALVFRRELYEKLGGFDESLDNLEDWNLWTRYSLQHDFVLVEKITSLYRVPSDTQKLIARQKILDTYYAQAIMKQRDMSITLSPAEIGTYYRELSRNINAIVIPYFRIRNFLIKNKLLNIFYYIAVRMVNKRRY